MMQVSHRTEVSQESEYRLQPLPAFCDTPTVHTTSTDTLLWVATKHTIVYTTVKQKRKELAHGSFATCHPAPGDILRELSPY